jgi:hypothetical protein
MEKVITSILVKVDPEEQEETSMVLIFHFRLTGMEIENLVM